VALARGVGDASASTNDFECKAIGVARWSLYASGFFEAALLTAVAVAGLRLYGILVFPLAFAALTWRCRRVEVVATSSQIRIVNRYRTYVVPTADVASVRLRRIRFGQGPFAVTVRLKAEPTTVRLRRGLIIEATAGRSELVNHNLAQMRRLVSSHKS
jgi:hypothetical protein